MKKITFLFLIGLWILYGCGASSEKNSSYSDSTAAQIDSTIFLSGEADSEFLVRFDKTGEDGTIIPVKQDTQLSLNGDSIKKTKNVSIKLDTTSVIHDLRKNVLVIDYQQKVLDSLIQQRKK
jgi:hypothetical protein